MQINEAKSKVKHHLPNVISAASLGALAAAVVWFRHEYPKNKIVINLPGDVLRTMMVEGRGVAMNSDFGWFTINHHANQPNEKDRPVEE